MWSRALPNATLKRAESSDRSDGLDELMAMAAATKPPATSMKTLSFTPAIRLNAWGGNAGGGAEGGSGSDAFT